MEINFGPVLFDPVQQKHSIISDKCPRSTIISGVNFTSNSRFDPWLLTSVNVQPTGVLKRFFEYCNQI